MKEPLKGVTVIEFCNVAAGPFCGMLLADMGADVIKIESPKGGDSLRAWPPITEGFSENFASLNRNKRSVALNLKEESDRDNAQLICENADIVIENNRPGVMKRLGLDYETLSQRNPSLVYVSISAYGQTGPRAQEGGFDLTIQAMSGIMSVTGDPGGAPVKCGVPLADFSAGLYGAYSALAALRSAQETGQGTHVDVPMLGATLGIAALQTSEYFGSGKDPVKLGSAHPRNAPYQAFAARDGYFGMAAGNDALWKKVCVVVDRPEWENEPKYETTTLRAHHQHELRENLETIFQEADCADWLERFRDIGVPCAPINSYSQVLADPQVEHMGWVQPLAMPNGVTTRTFGSPVLMGGTPQTVLRPPPLLGEHTEEILTALQRGDRHE